MPFWDFRPHQIKPLTGKQGLAKIDPDIKLILMYWKRLPIPEDDLPSTLEGHYRQELQRNFYFNYGLSNWTIPQREVLDFKFRGLVTKISVSILLLPDLTDFTYLKLPTG
jgi:hypothetical protein